MQYLDRKAWSPYAAGIIIGLLQIPALLIVGSALGASSCYVSASAYLAKVVDWSMPSNEYFAHHMTSIKYAFQGCLVIGIAIGANLSSRMSGMRRTGYSPIWKRALSLNTTPQRMAFGFVGGFIMLFGARWAGGCTSGHGLSGMGQLAISSMVVVVAMFAGGILTANLFRRI